MTTYSVPLQPPSAFRFDRPDEWGKWKRCFEQFRLHGVRPIGRIQRETSQHLALYAGRRR